MTMCSYMSTLGTFSSRSQPCSRVLSTAAITPMHQVPKGVTCHGKLGEISSCDEKPTMGKVFKIHQTELLHSRQDLPRLKMFSRGLSCWCKFQNAKGAMPPHSSVFPSDLARIQRITSSQAPLANFRSFAAADPVAWQNRDRETGAELDQSGSFRNHDLPQEVNFLNQ